MSTHNIHSLKGMDSLSREVNLSNCFCLPLEKESVLILKGSNYPSIITKHSFLISSLSERIKNLISSEQSSTLFWGYLLWNLYSCLSNSENNYTDIAFFILLKYLLLISL